MFYKFMFSKTKVVHAYLSAVLDDPPTNEEKKHVRNLKQH